MAIATSRTYRVALRLATSLVPVLALANSRIRAGYRARRHAGDRLLDWARRSRDPARPLVWFHAASVGEGLQAESVLLHLRRLRPECQVAYTHFSPSAERLASRIAADVADYLPYDQPQRIDPLLRSLEPDVLVFAKLDLWPELSTRAAAGGTKVAIVAATVSPGSGRLRWPALPLLQPGYRVIAAAAAVSPEDARRLTRIGVAPERIRVLGDPRFDSVMARVRSVKADDQLLRGAGGEPALVAGSTWPADEAVLLEAFARLLRQRPNARLILVPHEPTPEHLKLVEARAGRAGLPRPVSLGTASGRESLVLVDQVGVLATLYGAGIMAYVGGGFGRAGLHSVLEPAAWGLPVVFGPRWSNSRDARLLLDAGAAVALSGKRTGAAAAELHRCWEGWIRDDGQRQAQGDRARRVVEGEVGAAGRSAAMLAELISAPPHRRSPREVPASRQSES